MNVGNLYRLTERAKTSLMKTHLRYNIVGGGIDLYCNHPDETTKKIEMHRRVYPIDTLVVPLEVHRTTFTGKPLAGDNSRRIIVLLSTGDMGTMYVDINDWEEVC